MAIKGFEWMGADKMAHFVVGIMIFALCYFMLGFESSVSLLIVWIAGMAKEVFDMYRHKLGIVSGYFDKYDLIATVMGGSVVCGVVGILELF